MFEARLDKCRRWNQIRASIARRRTKRYEYLTKHVEVAQPGLAAESGWAGRWIGRV
jgi:hypothetical protein